jgi:hypothetical protein
MTRCDRPWTIKFTALAVAGFVLAASVGVALAADTPPTATDQEEQVQPKVRQLAPLLLPPGMSIMPSPPMMAPPASTGQPEGCPVRNLKPLELLV